MATKKPVRRMVSSASSPSLSLMGNQDAAKGDATADRKRSKCVTFWVSEEQKREISAYASSHHMTVSRLIVEGLEMRMAKE